MNIDNSKITSVKYHSKDADALYYGNMLVWKKKTIPNNIISGKIANIRGELWWRPNLSDDVKNTDISYEPTEPIYFDDNGYFSFEYDGILKSCYGLFAPKGERISSTSSRATLSSLGEIVLPITENVINMSYMFNQCSSLYSVNTKDWETKNVKNMGSMFYYCSSLQSLDLNNWNVGNVTDMRSMFNRCSSLQSLNLSNWNVENVTNIDSMFKGCSSLQSLDLSNWNTKSVIYIDGLFDDCTSLVYIDMSGIDTTNIVKFAHIFYNNTNLETVVFKDFNVKITLYQALFLYCPNIKNIYGNMIIEVNNLNGGEISFANNPDLTADSLRVIIEGLVDSNNSSKDPILFLCNAQYNKLTEEDIAIATSKGWTITIK